MDVSGTAQEVIVGTLPEGINYMTIHCFLCEEALDWSMDGQRMLVHTEHVCSNADPEEGTL